MGRAGASVSIRSPASRRSPDRRRARLGPDALDVLTLFAIRPDKWWITKSMSFGWISRSEYLGHHDPERWVVPGADEPEPVSLGAAETAAGGESMTFDAGASS